MEDICQEHYKEQTGFERSLTGVETLFLAIADYEVLHGCRQLVP